MIALISSFIFWSCSKDIEERITGTWKLQDVYRKKAFSKEHTTTGYETGLFIFQSNGDAVYINGNDTLTGYWKANICSELPGFMNFTGNDRMGNPDFWF